MGQELARDKHQPDIVPTRKTQSATLLHRGTRSIDRSIDRRNWPTRWLGGYDRRFVASRSRTKNGRKKERTSRWLHRIVFESARRTAMYLGEIEARNNRRLIKVSNLIGGTAR
jgi:hypothetical protein